MKAKIKFRYPRKKKKEIKNNFGDIGYAQFYNLGLKEAVDYYMDNEWRKEQESEINLPEGDSADALVAHITSEFSKEIDREVLRGLLYNWKKKDEI